MVLLGTLGILLGWALKAVYDALVVDEVEVPVSVSLLSAACLTFWLVTAYALVCDPGAPAEGAPPNAAAAKSGDVPVHAAEVQMESSAIESTASSAAAIESDAAEGIHFTWG